MPSAVFTQNKILPDTVKHTAATAADTLSKKPKAELLRPIHYPGLVNTSVNELMLGKTYTDRTDYRYTGDIISGLPFGFVQDLGSIGQPYEVMLNGNGYGKISFLNDGIFLNNRLLNAFDMNHFQSESFDSLEIIPLSMGFLYGNDNNPSAVNFISRQPDIYKSYSRIKFYQAPNTEGFIDGTFSVMPFHKLNTYFEITNQSIDPIYTSPYSNVTKIGTDLSNWLGSVRINYLLSKNTNIIADYRYHNSIVQLFGGIDAEQILQGNGASQFNTLLYDNLQAPVKFSNRYQKASGHNFNLRLLGNLLSNSLTDLSLYYQTNLVEFRQNESSTDYQENAASIVDNNESKTYGLNFRQELSYDFFDISALANYETTNFSSPLISNDISKNSFSVAGIAGLKLIDNSIKPVFFAKYLNYSGSGYYGIGGRIGLDIASDLKLNAGISSFQKPHSIMEETFTLAGIQLNKQRVNVLEISGEYSGKSFFGRLGYFTQALSNSLISAVKNDSLISDRAVYFNSKNISLQGINFCLNFHLWKILLSTNTAYYFNSANRSDYKVPEFTSTGGIYYIDTLFERNLHLKAGINYYTVGPQDYTIIDFEKEITSNYIWNGSSQSYMPISPVQTSTSFQIDFFLAGRIREAATVYIVFQNLTNLKYFIVPYYPKQASGLRFGVAWDLFN